MTVLYDGNGNIIEINNNTNSGDFGVSNYAVYEDGNGSARQGNLTYQGKTFYPITNQDQRQDKVRMYDGGVMLTLGDSYTAYMSSFFNTFASKHGLVQDNRGLASSTIAGSTENAIGYQPFWERLDKAIVEYTSGKVINGVTYKKEDVKLITFMGGANDWTTIDESQGINRIGSGINETNKETLYGALNYIFPTLLSTFPNADVVVILQPSNPNKGVQNMYLKENIVREMAELYSLPIADCCFNWHQHTNVLDKAKYWQSDNLHLTSEGHDEVVRVLENVVNNLEFSRH